MGWFYGFKLHLIINDRGEILNFMITPGNTDDREPLRNERYVQDIRGKLCGDRGYIGKALFEMLFINGIQLVTRVRNNMRNMLMRAEDKILLRKRAVIETGPLLNYLELTLIYNLKRSIIFNRDEYNCIQDNSNTHRIFRTVLCVGRGGRRTRGSDRRRRRCPGGVWCCVCVSFCFSRSRCWR